MDAKLKRLIERSRLRKMTAEERIAQRRSFVYGNTKLANDTITRDLVDAVDEAIDEGEPCAS